MSGKSGRNTYNRHGWKYSRFWYIINIIRFYVSICLSEKNIKIFATEPTKKLSLLLRLGFRGEVYGGQRNYRAVLESR